MVEPFAVENIFSILQKCRKAKSLSYSKNVHTLFCNDGLEVRKTVGNYIVPMLMECGSVFDAQEAFNTLVHRNEHSWTSLMLGCIGCGQSHHAFWLYQQMQHDNVDPSSHTLIALLKACTKLKDVKRGRQVHAHATDKGFIRDVYVGSTLIDMYAKCGVFPDAQEVFDKLPLQNVVSWNILLAGYIENGHPSQALECFEQMQNHGVAPDSATFISTLKACSNMGGIDKGRRIHTEIVYNGFEQDPFVCSTLIHMYASSGFLAEAQEVFDKLLVRDVVSWTMLIAGYADQGLGEVSLKHFEQMQLDGVTPDAKTFVCSLKACGSIQALDKGREIHTEIRRKGFEKHLIVGSTLVDMYVKCSSLAEAQDVFDKLPARDIALWNILIAGYAENGLPQKALTCFEHLQLEGLSPDAITFVCILKACASMRDIDKGRKIHAEITEKGFERDLFIGSTLVNMYAKCGSVVEARGIFDKLPLGDVTSWNSLIAGYGESGLGQEALWCLEQMQLEGVSPDLVTYLCSLKACTGIDFLKKGREIHRAITQKGFETEVFIGSALIEMYTRCGSLAEACEAFDKLPVKGLVSWNSVVAGILSYGLNKEVPMFFERMEQQGIPSNAISYIYNLKACGNTGAVKKGQKIHAEIVKKGFERDSLVGNTLVNMYAKCGLFSEAWGVFAKIPHQTIMGWNAIVGGFLAHKHYQEALQCLGYMHLDGIAPDLVTYVCILKLCIALGTIERGRETHIAIMHAQYENSPFLSSTLISMYVKCGSLLEAQGVFDLLSAQDVGSWNTLLAGYVEHGLGHEVLKCFDHMQVIGVCADAVTYVYLSKACSSIASIQKGREIHTLSLQKGFGTDLLVGNALIDMYTKCGSLLEAHKVLDNLPVQDVVSWNIVIAGYAENGYAEEALKCYEWMQETGSFPDVITFLCSLRACGSIGAVEKGQEIHARISEKGLEEEDVIISSLIDMYAKCGLPDKGWEVLNKLPTQNAVSWNALIAGYIYNGRGHEALKCLEKMQLKAVTPDAITFVWGLMGCRDIGCIAKGRYFHAEIVQKDYEKDVLVGSTLVDMYAKCGRIIEAWQVFIQLPAHNVVSWNALLAGYVENGLGEEALKCFEFMQSEGVVIDAITYNYSLKACSSTGAIDKAREIHTGAAAKGLERDDVVANTLIDMYARCGSLSEARAVFEKLPAQEVVSWNAMMIGYGMNHVAEMAIQCFEDMQEQKVKPDAVSFVCLLTACSRANLVFKGHQCFELMTKQYFITPTIDHYTCMIDILGRSGQLYVAEKLLETMICPPSRETWSALLSACKTYGEFQLGHRCFQQLVHICPENSSSYVLMANMHASQGDWYDAKRIEDLKTMQTRCTHLM